MFEFRDYQDLKSEKPIFLPEVGTFFNQDQNQAHALVESLVNMGVECIKGEILHTADVALDADFQASYYDKNAQAFKQENYRRLIERKIVSFAQYEAMFSYPTSKGLHLVFSVYDIEGADFARSIGAKAIKVASSNLVHQPLIQYLAQSGIPTIIDTGKAHFYEIARAVEWFRQAGGRDMLIEHSPVAPPAPPSEQYLSMLPILQETFNCPVGLSDHYDGNEMLLAAVPLGASILEKGVMFQSMQGEQDTAHAMTVEEVPQVLKQIAAISEATRYGMRPAPQATHAARMGVVAKCDLQPGEKLTLDKAQFAWPALGIPVEHWELVAGRKLRQELKLGQPIEWHMLD
ncbi:N-acetylneuraminate synthase family protein [Thiomicrorhabdus xiamenensis]|uniref:N-acetylneuraminate synthase family protein n=1 Tax=Thiomicrorhabdus xiamenensis TaxID=2739063 RepID=A0A7D4TB62_9GAMM|nr:N-acetylneuraminate synthase family protein [Thiomicrorhabdus xiamenensis]QKI89566.1 N-acetylneuraminate synthase family protein [Thiomicrorhabdus xiamenensis]